MVGNSLAQARIRHTKNAPEEILDASFRVIEALPSIAEGVEQMRSTHLAPVEREAFATAALTLRYEGNAPIQPTQLLETRRAEDGSSDLWTTMNVVQENLIRGGQQRADSRRRTRAISGLSEDVRLNRALWTLAEELKRLKG